MSVSWIALNSVKGLGPVRIAQLIQQFGTPEKIFEASPDLLLDQGVIPEACIGRLKDDSLFKNAEKQLSKCSKAGVQIITLADDDYPAYLKEIFAPPPVLYVRGDLDALKGHALAVVGTRCPTVYGKQIARSITADLSSRLVIVSGLAKGIDTAAHESCLEHGGRTIAVLGCGIDRIYPSENQRLAEQIAERGLLISEFPLGTLPESFNFPRRNRIISGLSCGVLVVEAGEKSGSLITAHYALQQGRDIFAVPGPVTSPVSAGTFNLLKEGAVPVRNAQDIFESVVAVSNQSLLKSPPSCECSPAAILSSDEQEVLNTLSENPVRIDEISEISGRAVSDLFDILLNLELKGFICQVCGQQYRRAV